MAIGGKAARSEGTRAAAAEEVRAFLARNADSLDVSLTTLSAALHNAARDPANLDAARAAFRLARNRYKRVEGAVELYAPALAAAFNSRRQEVDDDDAPPPSTLAPSGFPALEGVMWPRLDPSNADSARRLVDGMRPLAVRLRSLVPALVPTDAQVIEIGRQELARVATLGIAGFDAPRTGEAIRENAAAVDGVRDLFRIGGRRLWRDHARDREALDSTLARAAAYLRANPDFETFNRLAFISGFEEPAARALDDLRRAAGTTTVLFQRAWRADVPSVFGVDAFDRRVYAPSTSPPASPALRALGARLFFDANLSGPRTRSCASCHQPSRAFSDGVARPRSIGPRGSIVARNTPTLINAALQPSQFADERSASLEDQILEVLRSPAEMRSSVELASARLGAVAAYDSAFATAFGVSAKGAVTPLRVRQALAAYVRSLVALDSRFDRAVRGDTIAMSDEERDGFRLFMGKGGCGTCHFAPLFSGNTPPRYLNSDVEVVGTPASPRSPARLDADSGRARIDHLAIHLRAFKTPSLRNVALTAPYMHNGAFRTLDEVVAFYDRGGGRGLGAPIADQTLSADSLHLTPTERRAIIAFLGTLTDTVVLR
jgi:cytochrome c peroxidase